MPEFPEMTIIAEQFREHLVGRRVEGVEATLLPAVRPEPEEFTQKVKGQAISGAARRGKEAILKLEGGDSIWFARGLGGALRYLEAGEKFDETPQVTVLLDGGARLVLARAFMGHVYLVEAKDYEKEWKSKGPEAVSEELTLEVLKRRLASSTPIKARLMDQKVIAGIGNTYGDEILFRAKINPFRSSKDLSDEEMKHLLEKMKEVLTESIAEDGEEEYYDMFGKYGRYAFRVHDQAGKPCPVCGEKIVHKAGKGAKADYCPRCQV